MEIISTVALITINETLVIQLVSFLVFMYFFNRIMIKPLRGTADERQNVMTTMTTEIADAHQRYDELLEQIGRQESDAKMAAMVRHQELEAQGSQQGAEIFTQARQKVAQQKAAAQQMIEQKIGEARRSVAAEADTLAVSIMEKLLDRSLRS